MIRHCRRMWVTIQMFFRACLRPRFDRRRTSSIAHCATVPIGRPDDEDGRVVHEPPLAGVSCPAEDRGSTCWSGRESRCWTVCARRCHAALCGSGWINHENICQSACRAGRLTPQPRAICAGARMRPINVAERAMAPRLRHRRRLVDGGRTFRVYVKHRRLLSSPIWRAGFLTRFMSCCRSNGLPRPTDRVLSEYQATAAE